MIVAIIQARMASTRLLHKVARVIAGKPMLWWVIQRTQAIPAVDHVVVATSTEALDQWIVDHCAMWNVDCLRGSHEDVLDRYERVAQHLALCPKDMIVRVTADCPLLDPLVSNQVIQLREVEGGGYASNRRDWPDGLDTEVFSRALLREAATFASGPLDREHVTPWMRQSAPCRELPHSPSLRHLKWSVDTEDDLEYVRAIYGVGEETGWEATGAMCRRLDETPRQRDAALALGVTALRSLDDDPTCRPGGAGH